MKTEIITHFHFAKMAFIQIFANSDFQCYKMSGMACAYWNGNDSELTLARGYGLTPDAKGFEHAKKIGITLDRLQLEQLVELDKSGDIMKYLDRAVVCDKPTTTHLFGSYDKIVDLKLRFNQQFGRLLTMERGRNSITCNYRMFSKMIDTLFPNYVVKTVLHGKVCICPGACDCDQVDHWN